MSKSPVLKFRAEVVTYLRSCEHLISVSAVPHDPPFSPDEMEIVKYYATEVVKMLDQPEKYKCPSLPAHCGGRLSESCRPL
jgi:hypothetical protein